jgi:hypothetical protein
MVMNCGEQRRAAKAKYGSDLFSIGKVWQGAATAMQRSYRNREEKQTIMKGRYES